MTHSDIDNVDDVPASLVSGPAFIVAEQQTLEEIDLQGGLGITNLLGAQIRVWRNELPVVEESRKQQQTAHGEFIDMKLNPLLLANITKAGFIHPTPIEWAGIEKMFLYQRLKNCYDDGAKFYKNQMWLTQTGTGKTSTYVIALIELLSRRLKKAELEKRVEEPGKKCRPFAVIIVSIHELAEQIAQTIKMLSEGTQVEASALYGGTHVTNSFLRLTKEKKIVVATMGRLIEFAEAGAFDFSQLEYLIFDEFHEYIDSWKGYNMSQQCNQFLELLGNFTPASSRPYSVIMVSAANNATLRRIAMRMLSIENLERLPNDQIKVSHSREPQSVFSKQNPLTIISIGVENTVNPNITQKSIEAGQCLPGKAAGGSVHAQIANSRANENSAAQPGGSKRAHPDGSESTDPGNNKLEGSGGGGDDSLDPMQDLGDQTSRHTFIIRRSPLRLLADYSDYRLHSDLVEYEAHRKRTGKGERLTTIRGFRKEEEKEEEKIDGVISSEKVQVTELGYHESVCMSVADMMSFALNKGYHLVSSKILNQAEEVYVFVN